MNVEGERVLITGGWSGIGFAIDRNALPRAQRSSCLAGMKRRRPRQ